MGQITLGLPIPGQPDASEEVKIPSDFTILQTLLNGNIDRSNLAAGVGSLLLNEVPSTYAAVNGDMVAALSTGAVTITAPTPGVGVKFGVIAGFNATGLAPVTIARHGSEVFYGLGFMSGFASLTLGTAGSYIVFECDGTNWLQIAGQQDSGWVPLTLPAGVSALGAIPSARLQGDVVQLDGVAQSGSTISSGVLWATLPVFARSANSKIFACFGGSNTTGLTFMGIGATTGQVTLGSASISSVFDGIVYRL